MIKVYETFLTQPDKTIYAFSIAIIALVVFLLTYAMITFLIKDEISGAFRIFAIVVMLSLWAVAIFACYNLVKSANSKTYAEREADKSQYTFQITNDKYLTLKHVDSHKLKMKVNDIETEFVEIKAENDEYILATAGKDTQLRIDKKDYNIERK